MSVDESEGVQVGEVVWIKPKMLCHCEFDGGAVAVVFYGVFGVAPEEAMVVAAFPLLPSASCAPAVPDGAEYCGA